MFGSGWEALPDIREALRSLGVVEMLFRMIRSGREALLDVREWSGGPPGCPGVVGRPSRMTESGREALPDD